MGEVGFNAEEGGGGGGRGHLCSGNNYRVTEGFRITRFIFRLFQSVEDEGEAGDTPSEPEDDTGELKGKAGEEDKVGHWFAVRG